MKEKLNFQFNLDRAIELAEEYHKGQTDRSREPYIKHLFAVMDQLQGEDSQMAGVLHDIVEDTPMTPELLKALGCPPSVLEAIILVSHPPRQQITEEDYFEDIRRIAASGNQIAVDVKWADLTHNSDKARIQNPSQKVLALWEKYAKAKEILKPFVSEYLLGQ